MSDAVVQIGDLVVEVDLVGKRGPRGLTGNNGIDGVDGKSAYQLAVESGFSGTQAEWNTANASVLTSVSVTSAKANEATASASAAATSASAADADADQAAATKAGIESAIAGLPAGTLPVLVATRLLLRAISSPTAGDAAILLEGGREGTFVFSTANLSAMVSADPQQAVYVAPSSATTGASGAWVRKHDGWMNIAWFGAVEVPVSAYATPTSYATYDIKPALNAFETLAIASKAQNIEVLNRLLFRGRVYYCSRKDWIFSVHLKGSTISDSSTVASTVICGPVNADCWVFNRHDTLNGGVVTSRGYGADGSVIEGFVGLGANLTVSGTVIGGSTSGCFVRARCRISLRNGQSQFFGGDGVTIRAVAGGPPADQGNANDCTLSDWTSNYNGGSGVDVSGADGNVCTSWNLRCYNNRLWGLAENSFLGGGSHHVETGYNGVSDPTGNALPVAMVRYSGNVYATVWGQETAASTNAPSGTTADTANWIYVGPYSTPYSSTPTWISGITVVAGGALLTGFSTAAMTIQVYNESSQAPMQLYAQTLLTAPANGVRAYGPRGNIIGSTSNGVSSEAFSAVSQDGNNFTIIGSKVDPLVALSRVYAGGLETFFLSNSYSNTTFTWGYTGRGVTARWHDLLDADPGIHEFRRLALVHRLNGMGNYSELGLITSPADINTIPVGRGAWFFRDTPTPGSPIAYRVTTGGTGGTTAVLEEIPGTGEVLGPNGTAYTAALTDANDYIRFDNAAAVTFTIPPNSAVPFPIGTVINMEQAGAGALSVAAGAGVTINSRAADYTLVGQFSVAALKKVGTDTWTLTGDM